MIILDKQTLVWARRLESELHDHVQTTSGQQQRLWTDLGLGLAAVGATGGIGGMLLGFATASSMRRSILQLQVRLQDAAGKLGQDLPQFEWQFQGSLERIEEQFSILDQHIEDVVNRLQQRERDVMRADQLAKLGRVAAGVAHEIRNPLTAIKLLVQSSLETRMPPDKDDLVVIESEIRRMEASLNSMLDYARSARPEKSAVAPQPFIEGVADLVRNQAARQGVTLDCPVSYPDATVLADPGQIKQVLLNLALNALDAMPRGGKIQFDIDATPTTVNIYVTDNGPGVDKHFMTNMFEPFASTKETGVGLGLALSKRIVEDHGGQLTGENLPECGARFTVTLPRGDIMRGNVADDTRESELDQREETTHS